MNVENNNIIINNLTNNPAQGQNGGHLAGLKVTHEAGGELELNPDRLTLEAFREALDLSDEWTQLPESSEIVLPPELSGRLTELYTSALSGVIATYGGVIATYDGTKEVAYMTTEGFQALAAKVNDLATSKDKLTSLLGTVSPIPASGYVYLNAGLVHSLLKFGLLQVTGPGFLKSVAAGAIATSMMPTALPLAVALTGMATPLIINMASNVAQGTLSRLSDQYSRRATVESIEDVSDNVPEADPIANEPAENRVFSNDGAAIALATYQKLKEKGPDLTQNEINEAVKAAAKSKSGDVSVDVNTVNALKQWVTDNRSQLEEGFKSADISFDGVANLIKEATTG